MVRTLADTDEWRWEQLSTIGGSSAAAVIGKARWKTPAKLWRAMHAVLMERRLPPPLAESDDLRRGRMLEPIAIEQMSEVLGVPVRRHDQSAFVYNERFPWAHALPDGWCAADLAEVKVPRPGTIAKCNLQGLIPEWQIQAQHNMALCCNPSPQRCHVGLLDPMSCLCHVFTVLRDDEFIAQLMEEERLFMDAVRNEIPPPPENAEACEPECVDPNMLHLNDDEHIQLAQTWLRLRTIETDLNESIEVTKAHLQRAMGLSERAQVGNVIRINWKPRKGSRRLNKAAVLQEFPQIATDEKYWSRDKDSRPFTVYEMKQPF